MESKHFSTFLIGDFLRFEKRKKKHIRNVLNMLIGSKRQKKLPKKSV